MLRGMWSSPACSRWTVLPCLQTAAPGWLTFYSSWIGRQAAAAVWELPWGVVHVPAGKGGCPESGSELGNAGHLSRLLQTCAHMLSLCVCSRRLHCEVGSGFRVQQKAYNFISPLDVVLRTPGCGGRPCTRSGLWLEVECVLQAAAQACRSGMPRSRPWWRRSETRRPCCPPRTPSCRGYVLLASIVFKVIQG